MRFAWASMRLVEQVHPAKASTEETYRTDLNISDLAENENMNMFCEQQQ